MSPPFQRLKLHGMHFPTPQSQSKRWLFTGELRAKPAAFWDLCIQHYSILNFEYRVICSRLADVLQSPASATDEGLISLVQDALAMAEVLELLNRDFFKVSSEVSRLRRDGAFFRNYLQAQGHQFEKEEEKSFIDGESAEQNVNNVTLYLNTSRLLSSRTRNILLAIRPFTRELSTYNRLITSADQTVGPLFPFFFWTLYTPRIFMCLTAIMKHTIPGPWLSDKEKPLNWKTRFQSAWDKRWVQLCSDLSRLVAGLLNCFVLIGALSPWAIVASLAQQVCDLTLSSLRAYRELAKLYRLDKQYHEMAASAELSDVDKSDLESHWRFFKQHIDFEQKKLMLDVVHNSVILLGMVLMLPVFGLNPLVPLIGATIALLMTAVTYTINYSLDKNKPKTDISALSQIGLFKDKSPIKDDVSQKASYDAKTEPKMGLNAMLNACE